MTIDFLQNPLTVLEKNGTGQYVFSFQFPSTSAIAIHIFEFADDRNTWRTLIQGTDYIINPLASTNGGNLTIFNEGQFTFSYVAIERIYGYGEEFPMPNSYSSTTTQEAVDGLGLQTQQLDARVKFIDKYGAAGAKPRGTPYQVPRIKAEGRGTEDSAIANPPGQVSVAEPMTCQEITATRATINGDLTVSGGTLLNNTVTDTLQIDNFLRVGGYKLHLTMVTPRENNFFTLEKGGWTTFEDWNLINTLTTTDLLGPPVLEWDVLTATVDPLDSQKLQWVSQRSPVTGSPQRTVAVYSDFRHVQGVPATLPPLIAPHEKDYVLFTNHTATAAEWRPAPDVTHNIPRNILVMGNGLGQLINANITQDDTEGMFKTSYGLATELGIKFGVGANRTFLTATRPGTNNIVLDMDVGELNIGQSLGVQAERLDATTLRLFLSHKVAAGIYIRGIAYEDGLATWEGHTTNLQDVYLLSSDDVQIIGNVIMNMDIPSSAGVASLSSTVTQQLIGLIDPTVSSTFFVDFTADMTISLTAAPTSPTTIMIRKATSTGVLTLPAGWSWAYGYIPDPALWPLGSTAIISLNTAYGAVQAFMIRDPFGDDIPLDQLKIVGPKYENGVAEWLDFTGEILYSNKEATMVSNKMVDFHFNGTVDVTNISASVATLSITNGVLDVLIKDCLVFSFDHIADITTLNISIDATLSAAVFRFKLIKKPGVSTQSSVVLPLNVSTPALDTSILYNPLGIGISEFLYDNGTISYLGTTNGGSQ